MMRLDSVLRTHATLSNYLFALGQSARINLVRVGTRYFSKQKQSGIDRHVWNVQGHVLIYFFCCDHHDRFEAIQVLADCE